MYNFDQYMDVFLQFNLTEEDLEEFENYTNIFDLSNTDCYCNGFIRDWAMAYKMYYSYIAIIFCIFGIFTNILNIIVLTHKKMITIPINKILTGLALADMLVMLDYIPFAIYLYLILPRYRIFPYGWAVYILFHMHFTQLFHTISIGLTLTLAFWRYIVLRFLQRNHAWCTPNRCKVALWCCVLVPLIVCAPSYFVFGIRNEVVIEYGTAEILYYVDTDYTTSKGFVYRFNFWILGVVVKLMPCLILTIITCWLIITLCRTKDRTKALKNHNPQVAQSLPTRNNSATRRNPTKNEKHAERSTGLFWGILGDCFFHNCYHNFGEIMDILALFNGSINCLLYCLMPGQYRKSFGRLFRLIIMRIYQTTSQQTEVQTTYVLSTRPTPHATLNTCF